MASKNLGLILIIVGALAVALLFKPINDFLNLPLGDFGITDTILTIIGVAAIVVGFFLMKGKRYKHKSAEVPIYKGKEIVGYRRVR